MYEGLECVTFIVILFLLAGEAYEAGESGHLGDDSETSREPAAPTGGDVSSY
jgi:hypothetical protein